MDFSLWRVGPAELAGGGERVVDRFLTRRAAAREGAEPGPPVVCRLEGSAPDLDDFFTPPTPDPTAACAAGLVVYGGDPLYDSGRGPVLITGLSPRRVPHVARHLESADLTTRPAPAHVRARAAQIRALYRHAAAEGEAVLKVAVY